MVEESWLRFGAAECCCGWRSLLGCSKAGDGLSLVACMVCDTPEPAGHLSADACWLPAARCALRQCHRLLLSPSLPDEMKRPCKPSLGCDHEGAVQFAQGVRLVAAATGHLDRPGGSLDVDMLQSLHVKIVFLAFGRT